MITHNTKIGCKDKNQLKDTAISIVAPDTNLGNACTKAYYQQSNYTALRFSPLPNSYSMVLRLKRVLKGLTLPEHPVRSLCCLTHSKLHET